MATFEFSTQDGATYEVEAPDEGTAIKAFQENIQGGAPKAPAKELPELQNSHGGSFVSGLVEGIGNAIQFAGDVARGNKPVIDPDTGHVTDEAVGRAFDTATIFNPAPPGGMLPATQGALGVPRAQQESWTTKILGGGRPGAPTVAPPPIAPVPVPNTPAVAAADRLSQTGEPVRMPQGVASDSPTVQAIYQRGAQIPGASGIISKSVDNFVGDVSGKAGELARRAAGRTAEEGLPTADVVGSGIRSKLDEVVGGNETAAQRAIADAETNARSQIGNADAAAQTARQEFDALAPQAPEGTKAAIGDELTDALTKRTEFHRAEQEKPYNTLRQLIDADTPVPLSPSLQKTFQEIGEARVGAGFEPWPGGTQAVARTVSRGEASFNNLQRLRSHVGGMISDWKPGGGFDVADLKRIYGSLTDAMQNAVTASAKGGAGQAALGAFQRAETNFGSRANIIGELNTALRNGPESLVDRMVGYASERGGANLKKLQELQRELPGGAQDKVSRLAFQRLSRGADGQFSETALVKNWANLSPEGKQALFRSNAPKIEAAIRKLQGANASAKATRDLAEASLKAETKVAQANAKAASQEYVRMLAQSDEQLARNMLKLATDGAQANSAKLARMAHMLGPEQMKGLAALQIQEMGIGRTGEFSPAAFRSAWNNLSASGKAMLFPDLGLRRSLEDLNIISAKLVKAEEKFKNKSGTGGAVGLGALGAGLVTHPYATIATVVGANMVARVLSKPAVAKAAVDYGKAAEVYLRAPSRASLKRVEQLKERLVNLATRAAANDNTIGIRAAAASGEPEEKRQRAH